MNILIVAATEFEIRNLAILAEKNIDTLITGIGPMASVFKLYEQLLLKRYDLVIDVGIAGSFSTDLEIGTVVQVTKESFGDLGFEDKNAFIPISQSPIGKKQKNSFHNPNSFEYLKHLKAVESITVSCSSGQQKTITERQQYFKADIENMEGAGIFYVCIQKNIPFMEIRSISNFIEERNTENWNIPLALERLEKELTQIIKHLTSTSHV